MASVGLGFAQGVQSGFGMGMQLVNSQKDAERQQALDAERQQDRDAQAQRLQFEQRRADRQDAQFDASLQRQDRQDTRQFNLDQMALLQQQEGDLRAQGEAMLSQYGSREAIPQAEADAYVAKLHDLRSQQSKIRTDMSQPLVQREQQRARDNASRLQTGQISVDQMSDRDFYMMAVANARRSLDDFFAGKDGSPSAIQQAGLDLQAGLETGNDDLTFRGANVLLAPDIQKGVGERGKDGTIITGKRLVKVVPHPTDPGLIVPVIAVDVEDPVSGRTGTYTSFTTENRSSDPQDNIKPIALADAFKRAGELTTASAAFNTPELRAKLERGKEAAGAEGDELLGAFTSLGIKKPTRKVSVSTMNLGDRTIETTRDENGQVIGRETFRAGMAPTRGPGLSEFERQLAAAVRSGQMTQEDADKLVVKRLGTLASGSGGGKTMTDGQAAANLFGTRMLKAAAIIDRLEAQGVRMTPAQIYAGDTFLGAAANAAATPEQQQLARAKRDYINATLRRESGAAIGKDEFTSADKQYFAQPGESGDVLGDKRAGRVDAADLMLATVPEEYRGQGASGALVDVKGQIAETRRQHPDNGKTAKPGATADTPAQPKSQADYDALPAGAYWVDDQGNVKRKR